MIKSEYNKSSYHKTGNDDYPDLLFLLHFLYKLWKDKWDCVRTKGNLSFDYIITIITKRIHEITCKLLKINVLNLLAIIGSFLLLSTVPSYDVKVLFKK